MDQPRHFRIKCHILAGSHIVTTWECDILVRDSTFGAEKIAHLRPFFRTDISKCKTLGAFPKTSPHTLMFVQAVARGPGVMPHLASY